MENKDYNCFVLVTHKYNEFVRQQWKRIRLELSGSNTKPFIMFDFSRRYLKENDLFLLAQDLNNNVISIDETCLFDEQIIRDTVWKRGYTLEYYEEPNLSLKHRKIIEAYINYKLKLKGYNFRFKYKNQVPNLFYGNIMTAYMYFFMLHQEFNYYWFKEWDVEYTGNWKSLVEKYNRIEDDLITRTAFKSSNYDKKWFHYGQWKTTTIDKFKDTEIIITFNPIIRISHRALDYLDILYREGNSGFYELFLGTVLNRAGYKLGGFKEYGDLDFSTFTYIPKGKGLDISKVGLKSNKLYHPIKEPIEFRIDA